MTDLPNSVPPCFRAKFFVIYQDFSKAYQMFEEQYAILPESNRKNINLDVYIKIIDDTLQALACISNTFNPQICSVEPDIKSNVKTAEEALKRATLNCYKYSLAAINVDVELIYKKPKTASCLKDMSYADFRKGYEDFMSSWRQARNLELQAGDPLQAYITATTTGARLKNAINLSILEGILIEQEEPEIPYDGDYPAPVSINLYGGDNIRDKYSINQAGAVGPNANARDMNWIQIWEKSKGKIELDELIQELEKIRPIMHQEAVTGEQQIAVGEVAKAQEAAKNGNGPQVLEHLKATGKMALPYAEKIGVPVAIEAIKASIGLK